MDCKNCERLRRKLSPLEDRTFTDEFLTVEPRWFYEQNLKNRQGVPHVAVQLGPLFMAAFVRRPTGLELTKLGRTMDALGWERTKRNGALYFCMNYEEFSEEYYVHRNHDRPDDCHEAGHRGVDTGVESQA